ncbi:MAG: GNAT family N-acetyltransferase [Candidatus Jordarchaeum sp.]|uniref:GNAT family N-acetyltransferase n=1 Tax=Candidatus Jordarchaeum sp. TaxID=2823881 RepID=UPI00404ABE19
MDGLVIERAKKEDLNTLYQIEKECFPQNSFPKPFLKFLIIQHNSVFLKAKIRDEVIGFIVGIIQVPYSVGRIYSLDVKPDFRRKGVAASLLQALENEFKQKGVNVSLLEVDATNTAALNLYQKFSYRPIRVLKNYYGKQRDGIKMTKNLI